MTALAIILSILLLVTIIKMFIRPINKGYKAYLIRKGKHYYWGRLWGFKFAPRTMRWITIFGQGVEYSDDLSGDINKLYGYSGADIHHCSCRIGWRYNSLLSVIELYSYWYNQGKRYSKLLCTVGQYEQFTTTMFHNGHYAIIEIKDVDGDIIAIDKIPLSKLWFRVKAFPYYGGNLPSPVDLTIFIQDI